MATKTGRKAMPKIGDHVSLIAYGARRDGQIIDLKGTRALVEYERTGRFTWSVVQGWRELSALTFVRSASVDDRRSQNGFGAALCGALAQNARASKRGDP